MGLRYFISSLTKNLSSGYDITIYFRTSPSPKEPVPLLEISQKRFREGSADEKVKKKGAKTEGRMAYRPRLLLALVAVDRRKMEFVSRRKKTSQFFNSYKTLDLPPTIRQKIYTC